MKRTLALLLTVAIVFVGIGNLTAFAADKSNYSVLERYSGTTPTPAASPKPSTSFGFTLTNQNTFPGEVVVITVTGATSADSIKVDSELDFKPNFFESSAGVYTALLPVNYRSAVGSYPITITSGSSTQTKNLNVQDKKFQIQNLEIDNSVAQDTINSDKANTEFENKIAPIRPVYSNTPYFKSENFVWPVGKGARVTTEFGMIRHVNGAPTSSRHGAIDFAVPKGTPVYSTNGGKVLYSGFLQLTGNTVVVEHGYGLKSWYYHMDTLNVKTDDVIASGKQIGTVGTTGFSSGNHLHFGMSVNNVFVNPKTIIDGGILAAA